MGTNALGDAIKASIDALPEVDKVDRSKVMRALGNPIEDFPFTTTMFWVSTLTYVIDSIVNYVGKLYHSLQNNNLNHIPLSSPTWWKLLEADGISIADAGSRYTGTEVETALQELAGSGRTTQTVKANADAIATHAGLTNPHSAVAAPTADRLVLRDAAGRAQIVAPSVAADIVNKGTLDTHAALTGSSAHGAVSAATASQLMTRDAAGRAQVVAPSADADIAIKGWVRDFIYPVGSYYTQYPDASSNDDATEFPTSQRPATLFGGTWTEQWPTESVYFRTRGTLSDTGRTNGKQEDQIQGHWHQGMKVNVAGTVGGGNNVAIGPNANNFQTLYAGIDTPRVEGAVTDGTNGTPRTGAETRVVNRRIKVWKRTA